MCQRRLPCPASFRDWLSYDLTARDIEKQTGALSLRDLEEVTSKEVLWKRESHVS